MTENAIQPWASLNVHSVLLILAFTLLSGLGDAAGFVCASRVWSDGRFVWVEALKCIAGFQFGMIMYWLALWKLSAHGIVSVEIQTFALLNGRVLSWAPLDQAVAAGVLAGVMWLMYRGANA